MINYLSIVPASSFDSTVGGCAGVTGGGVSGRLQEKMATRIGINIIKNFI